MSISPVITFKAGRCELDTSNQACGPYSVTPDPKPGYIYLYAEDECMHFCWRERNKPVNEPDLDLLMFPTDAQFDPYQLNDPSKPTAKTNGRIFALKFSSSSARYLFWLQSKPQARNGDPAWFSPRDLKIGQIVDTLLQGDEVNVEQEIAQVQRVDNGDDDQDETMEDVEGHDDSPHQSGGSGSGSGATGRNMKEEGSGSREGGADGGRAADSGPVDTATVVQNFLNSLQGGRMQQQSQGKLYTTLPDLLPSNITISTIECATSSTVDGFLRYLPPTILLLAQESAAQIDGIVEPSPANLDSMLEALSLEQKKAILKRVLRSPQFHQSLGSLTMAIRDGGLPTIAEALAVRLENGGLVKGGSVPLGGGEAVEAFVEGIKREVEKQS